MSVPFSYFFVLCVLNSNIIEEKGRPRRRCATEGAKRESNDNLPSDLSGEELSVSSEGDDGEDYAVSSAESD